MTPGVTLHRGHPLRRPALPGLMQLMPATGALLVARKVGMSDFSADRVTRSTSTFASARVTCAWCSTTSTAHPALATAPTTPAGPGRGRGAPRCRARVEGAVFAETIPSNETRDYVKKVIVELRLLRSAVQERAQSLKTRLVRCAVAEGRRQHGAAIADRHRSEPASPAGPRVVLLRDRCRLPAVSAPHFAPDTAFPSLDRPAGRVRLAQEN